MSLATITGAARPVREDRSGPGSVRARVAELLACEPAAGASAGAQAAWLSRLAEVLGLLAGEEPDPDRAAVLRTDATAARASSRVLGLAHVRDVAVCGGAR